MKKPKQIRWREIAETALADNAALSIRYQMNQHRLEQALEEHNRTLKLSNAALELIFTIRQRLEGQDGFEDIIHAIRNLKMVGVH